MLVCKQLLQDLQRLKWPVVLGEITSYQINRYKAGGKYRYFRYAYDLYYTYEVNGNKYRSVGRIKGFDNSSEAEAEAISTDKTIKVFYNPEKHEESVLSTGIRISDVMMLLLMSAVFAAFIYFSLEMITFI